MPFGSVGLPYIFNLINDYLVRNIYSYLNHFLPRGLRFAWKLLVTSIISPLDAASVYYLFILIKKNN